MTDDNVINFPQIGFTLAPTTVLDPPTVTPPNPPTNTPDTSPARRRRSPLDILNALPTPGLTQPVITPTPAADPIPAPGMVPDTFRSEPGDDDMIGPRLGALSLAAILAVAVAALRGAHTVAGSWWERRQARYAETAQLREARLKHQMAMQNIGDKAAQQRAKTNSKTVPSSSEFGRKTLGSRGGKGGSGSSGSGSGGGQSKKSPSGSGGTGPKRKNTPKGPGSGGSGAGGLGGSGGGGKRRKDRGTGGGGLLFPNRKSPKQPRNRTDKNTNNGGRGDRKPGGTKNRPGLGPLSLLKNRRNKNNGTTLQKKQPNTPKQQSPKTNLRKQPRTPNPKQQTPANGRLNRMKNAATRWWKNQQRTPKSTAGATNTKNTRNNPKQNGPTNPGGAAKRSTRRTRPGRRWTRAWWAKVRARAQKNTAKPGPAATGGPQAPGAGASQTPGGSGTGPGAGAGPWGTGRTRRSPFQNAGQATAANSGFTVERDDYPGAQAKTWTPDALTTGQPALAATGPAALTPAPGRYPKRPGTSRPRSPIPMPPAPVPARTDPRLIKARNQAKRAAQQTVGGPAMDAQHETEITLDDTCDAADKLSEDGFTTHDQARALAQKARDLRDTFLVFADDLATNHNLIGALFTGASLRFAESMELVARMSEEMETSSLEAAEKAETAGNEINDAYRPYTTEAADRGLPAPSAPVHNQT